MTQATTRLREKRPGADWREVPTLMPARRVAVGGASSTWVRGPIRVISSLIEAELPGDSSRRGLQWLVSVTTGGKRPKPQHVKKALRAFGMRGAEEDNHHPGDARHFFLVVEAADRVDCECKTDETVRVDADGYSWSQQKDGPCAGCEIEMITGRPCAEHTPAAARAGGW